MERREWLDGLAVGRVVACMSARGHYCGTRMIEKETKLYWVIGTNRYRKRDGNAPGGDIWGSASIDDPQSDYVKRSREQSRKSVAAGKIREANLKGLTADQLESIVAYIESIPRGVANG